MLNKRTRQKKLFSVANQSKNIHNMDQRGNDFLDYIGESHFVGGSRDMADGSACPRYF